MIPEFTLKYLASQKLKDAKVLRQHNRKAAAVYLMGYAVEFNLKRKIIRTMGFNKGFPETHIEFNSYSKQVMGFNSLSTGIQISNLRQLKNHNLGQLIDYTGVASRIMSKYSTEWFTVASWNPENRYKWKRYNESAFQLFMNSAEFIIRELF